MTQRILVKRIAQNLCKRGFDVSEWYVFVSVVISYELDTLLFVNATTYVSFLYAVLSSFPLSPFIKSVSV